MVDLPTSRKDRLCNICNSNSIDDETHFLITCGKYDHQRKEIYQLKLNVQIFSALDEEQKCLVTQY